jgi:hypothetical protein
MTCMRRLATVVGRGVARRACLGCRAHCLYMEGLRDRLKRPGAPQI